jgi:PAS domain S-box-containing protein/putative nucleotidyltransferase with HDIG domain
MYNSKFGKDLNSKAAQLELLIIAMVGATLGYLQILNYVFLNAYSLKTPSQLLLDWFFSMAIITFLVHFSFREIRKVQEELIEKGVQADKAQRRLQHIIDNTQETIFVIDLQGGFKFASQPIEDLTGYTTSEVANMHIDDILTYEYKSLVQSELSDYNHLGGRHLFVDFLRKDGRTIRVELCFMKVETDERGQVIQCLAREFIQPKDTENPDDNSQFPETIASINRITEARLNSNYLELGNIFHRVMLSHDPATALHQMRLAVLIGQIGEELGIAIATIEWLKLGALLHDVGKLAVPYKILNKAGKLNANEFTTVRLHAKRGIELLGSTNLPPIVNDMILHHHERLDGSGYPHGLRAGNLTMETRILSVCDVTESMISHRSYRQALPKEEVTEVLVQGKGTKFDTNVVECVLGVINRKALSSGFTAGKELLKVV